MATRFKDGERLSINKVFYQQQGEDTLDYNYDEVDFYESVLDDYKPVYDYKLRNQSSSFVDFFPSDGQGVYVVISNTSLLNYKTIIYSHSSNEVTLASN